MKQSPALVLVLAAGLPSLSSAEPTQDAFLMCAPGEELFSDDFEPGNVSDRWGIRAFFTVEDGILKRTGHQPEESARTFLKDAAYHNVVIRFDFRFDGASEVRLVTGGGGGYNTGIHIQPAHFEVTTAKHGDEFVPSWQGECAFDSKPGEWHTMTVEFNGDEVVAHLDADHFVLGRHPIIDTERTYLAFQVNGSAAAFDNFSIWESKPIPGWNSRREKLVAAQAARPPAVERDAKEEYDLILLRLKDRLSREDPAYRSLVAHHEKLQADLKTDYPKAFQTHKELSKGLAKKKLELKKGDPRFAEMENAANKARRAEKDYIHSLHPELDDQPDHLYYAAFERHRKAMASDSRLIELQATTSRLEKEWHESFPAAFQDVDALVEERNAHAESLRKDAGFQARKKAIANAGDAINNYLSTAEPRLIQLSEARMAIIRTANAAK